MEIDERAAAFSAATMERGRDRVRSGPDWPLEGGRLCHESVGVREIADPVNVLASASNGESFSLVGEDEVAKEAGVDDAAG